MELGISAIYDGYLFASSPHGDKFDLTKPGHLESLELIQYTGHDSICYAMEFIPESNNILTSSFYDSTL